MALVKINQLSNTKAFINSRSFRFALLASALLLGGCRNSGVVPQYQVAASLPAYQQDSFEAYVTETKQWLTENRIFQLEDKEKELRANLPYELKPENPNGQGVLLVHGLADSPYSFVDVAAHLVRQGYLVRTILLPGHGSKVGDLMLPTLSDWQGVVSHHTALLKEEVDAVWLGGYSTGANLVTSQAVNDDDIAGLLLFSPAFKPNAMITSLAPVAEYFVTWADQDPEDNYTRYNSLPMNGAAVYYQTSKVVREDLDMTEYNKPVFMILSEGDEVIDKNYAVNTFSTKMNHENSKIIWAGEKQLEDSRAVSLTMNLPELHIVTGSHQGVLFSPENEVYGPGGEIIICSDDQTTALNARCKAKENVWYGAYGLSDKDKAFARLTWNPYFEQSMQLLDLVMDEKQKR